MISRLLALVGLELTPNNHLEKLLSGLGGTIAIAATMLLTHWLVGPDAVMPVVASMGASAVLMFAVPHGPLSQPWSVVMGHLISAVVGVACAKGIANPMLAGGVSVGVAITLMYYARCIHPPGGATALTAVLGGPALRHLGFSYVLLPVAVNVAVMVTMAVAFNYAFKWRRYPAALSPHAAGHGRVLREDWSYALTQIASLADVTEEELVELQDLATQHAARRAAERRGGAARRHMQST